MSDLIYVLSLFGIVLGGAMIIAALEWHDRNPPDWVVRAKMRRR